MTMHCLPIHVAVTTEQSSSGSSESGVSEEVKEIISISFFQRVKLESMLNFCTVLTFFFSLFIFLLLSAIRKGCKEYVSWQKPKACNHLYTQFYNMLWIEALKQKTWTSIIWNKGCNGKVSRSCVWTHAGSLLLSNKQSRDKKKAQTLKTERFGLPERKEKKTGASCSPLGEVVAVTLTRRVCTVNPITSCTHLSRPLPHPSSPSAVSPSSINSNLWATSGANHMFGTTFFWTLI